MSRNPILDFEIDRVLGYVGEACSVRVHLAEPDGTLWAADARGGVVRIANGHQELITQAHSDHFQQASSDASRYLEGTLPNGLAFARSGDILISNFGTDRLEVMSRDGQSRVLADSVGGTPVGKVNFVLRDSKDRIWVTVSTKVKNWMHALRLDLADGYIARLEHGTLRIVADGFHFTNEIRFDAREEFSTSSRRRADASRACASTSGARSASARCSGRAGSAPGRGPTALPSTAMATCGAPSSIPTSSSC